MITHDNAKAMYSTYMDLKKKTDKVELQAVTITPGKPKEVKKNGTVRTD